MRYLEDYEIGKSYELGSYKLETKEIIEFGQKYDPQYYHINDELGKQSLFGGLVASGWQVSSIWMRLYVLTMLNDAAVEGSPGVDEMRWLHPVKPGDLLTGRLTITKMTPSLSRPNCAILHKNGELLDQKGRPVMQLVLYSIFQKRPINKI